MFRNTSRSACPNSLGLASESAANLGDGTLGEDIGNLVPASVLDLLLAHELLDQLDERLTSAYLDGLREAALGR